MSAVAGAAVAAQPATPAPLRGAPRPRPGAELPDRLEHPRGDRARGRARSRTTWCSRSAAASGVLSEHLAERVAHVHVIEVDERLREALEDATDRPRQRHGAVGRRDDARPGRPRAAARQGRREPPLRDRRGLRCCARSSELPSVSSWVAMVQREVGERLAAAPGSARLRHARPCSRSSPARCGCCARSRARVFHPVPNVDSVLVGACAARRQRSARASRRSCAHSSAAAFAHRRKTLAGSLRARRRERRDARASRCGRRSSCSASAPTCAPSASPPEDFRALARLLEL